jgi:hypothetical protein
MNVHFVMMTANMEKMCNLYSNTSVNLETWNQLPKDKVHENCSLLKEDCIITITTD